MTHFHRPTTFARFSVLLLTIFLLSANSTMALKIDAKSFPVKYKNELFYIGMPTGWCVDASQWGGLDAFQNMVDLYHPFSDVVWFHLVKTFMPVEFDEIDQAVAMAKMAREMRADNGKLVGEHLETVKVGGYPARILYFENYEDNQTIVQKQYVIYLADSHIVLYCNEIFLKENQEKAERIGDPIINTVKINKVKNPLDNPTVLRKVVEKEMSGE